LSDPGTITWVSRIPGYPEWREAEADTKDPVSVIKSMFDYHRAKPVAGR